VKKVFYVWLTVLLLLIALVGKELYSGTKTAEDKYPIYKDLELFADVLTIVQKSYVKELSAKDLIYGAIKGITDSLDDHSQFLDPDEYKEIKIETEGEFGGLGIEITIKNGYPTIVTPLEDSPAYNAGLKPGDKIIKIDGKSTENSTLNEAVKKLRGEPGTKVNLTILRPEKKEFMDFSIERSFIKIESVKEVQIINDTIGYVRITQFQETTAIDAKKAIEKILPQCSSGIILDLRNNPGGLLENAIDVAGFFIEEPKILVSTKGRLPDQNQEFKSKNKNPIKNTPIVVLINKGSASGSEIVAGAVKDWHRGVLVGTNSFGKGSVQSVLPLRDGSALKLTTATYFTPSGTDINKVGIKPDIEITMTEEQEETLWKSRSKNNHKNEKLDLSIDPQLQRAVDLLKGISVYKEVTQTETSSNETPALSS
jgi:carboxyl-terminal processing protease